MSDHIHIHAKAAIEPKAQRFRVEPAYSGGPIRVGGWNLPVVVDLAGLEHDRVVANLDHAADKRVGMVDVVTNDGRTLSLAGAANAATDSAKEFIDSARRGFEWAASIEVDPSEVESVKRGEKAQANGREFTGPLYVIRKGRLVGIAFVSQGADSKARAKLAAKRKAKMSDFMQWARECGLDTSLMTADQMADIRANYHGRSEPIDEDHDAVAPLILASADSVALEDKRLRQIDAAVRGDWGDHAEDVQQLKASAVGGELSVDDLIQEMRTIRLRKMEANFPDAAKLHPVRGRRGGDSQVLEASLALAGNLSSPEKHFDERTLDAADKSRDIGLHALLIQAACQHGYKSRPGERITQGNLRTILAHAFPPIHATGFSGIDIPNTVANTANKFLREGWVAVDQTALRISGRGSAKDFKQMTTVSLLGDLEHDKLGPAGEIKHGTLGEGTYTNQVDTYARMLAITRQDLINDDLSALTAVPRRLGRGAMLKLNSVFWTIFLNNAAVFTSGRNNLNEGVATVTIEGLAATEKIFLNQTDPDGQPLGLMPAILLVPPTRKRAAMGLMNSSLIIDGTGTDAQPSGNTFQQAYRVESSPYMENATFTGYSTDYWYLMADPAQLPLIEIAALNGNIMPTVETAEADFNVLGLQMRSYSDVGVAFQEYRAGVKADGGAS